MFDNPLAAARLLANAALVMVLLAFCGWALLGAPADPAPWVWATGGVAVAGALAQFAVSVLFPRAIRPAWDQQVGRTHAGAHGFGYWMTLVVFLGLLLATQAGWLTADTAFYWLAPVLAAAPSVYMLVASLAGRTA
ncbi:MAG TPA: hypothetical protein DIU07_05105 [Rhodobacteraceae bacterium]|nr:hypothetical protein [Paracoccaceae bacterium]